MAREDERVKRAREYDGAGEKADRRGPQEVCVDARGDEAAGDDGERVVHPVTHADLENAEVFGRKALPQRMSAEGAGRDAKPGHEAADSDPEGPSHTLKSPGGTVS